MERSPISELQRVVSTNSFKYPIDNYNCWHPIDFQKGDRITKKEIQNKLASLDYKRVKIEKETKKLLNEYHIDEDTLLTLIIHGNLLFVPRSSQKNGHKLVAVGIKKDLGLISIQAHAPRLQ